MAFYVIASVAKQSMPPQGWIASAFAEGFGRQFVAIAPCDGA
ncbi:MULTISPECIES: hypothetical protein [unclassified Bradyrhizobium]|nr:MULTISPECIES: hypothetical protein [unclassified Bradyrhizobium]